MLEAFSLLTFSEFFAKIFIYYLAKEITMKTKILSVLLSVLIIIPMIGTLGVALNATSEIQNPFIDLPDGKWFTDASLYCYKYGYMSGTGDRKFAPNDKFTRAMFVTVLYQIDLATEKYTSSSFKDVKVGSWYANAVEWAYQNDYASGLGDGKFGPTNVVTREQLASFLYTYSKLKGYDVSGQDDLSAFTDAQNISRWALKSVKWAVAENLLRGVGNGQLSSKGQVTRAQIAVILKKYLKNHGVQWDDGVVITERTCTQAGETLFTSLDGNNVKMVTYKAWHLWDTGKITKTATCAAEGEKLFTCTICKNTRIEKIRKLTTHSWDAGTIIKPASCIVNGIKQYKCLICNIIKEESIKKLSNSGKHTWDSGKVLTAATCQKEGEKRFTCSVCKESYIAAIPKISHNYIRGKCTYCGKVQSDYKRISGTWYMDRYYNRNTGKTVYVPKSDAEYITLKTDGTMISSSGNSVYYSKYIFGFEGDDYTAYFETISGEKVSCFFISGNTMNFYFLDENEDLDYMMWIFVKYD